MNTYSIGQVAKEVGIPAKTIRFYEDAGVLSPAIRLENGYRTYEKQTIEELKVIKYARDLGLPLQEIKKLLTGCCGNGTCTHTREYLLSFVTGYLSLTQNKIQELTTLQSRLQKFKSNLELNNTKETDEYCCNIFQQIIEQTKQEKGGE